MAAMQEMMKRTNEDIPMNRMADADEVGRFSRAFSFGCLQPISPARFSCRDGGTVSQTLKYSCFVYKVAWHYSYYARRLFYYAISHNRGLALERHACQVLSFNIGFFTRRLIRNY